MNFILNSRRGLSRSDTRGERMYH